MSQHRFACVIVAVAIVLVESNGFLKTGTKVSNERVSEADIQASLLEEVEDTLGTGVAANRLRSLETILKPVYTALPKNEHGKLGHETVRYALHRLFLARHGWHFKSLARDAEPWNVTSPAGVLKEQMPAYLQNLFEQRLGDKGLGLHDLATMGATIEHLVHREALSKLGDIYAVFKVLPTQLVSEIQADKMLDTFMAARIYGENIKDLTLIKAGTLLANIAGDYVGWPSTRDFIRQVKDNITRGVQNATQRQLDFATMTKIAEVVGEEFGNTQSTECQVLKSTMMKMDSRGSGRVKLGDFYKPGLDGNWQFQEKPEYLRQIGALDEADPNSPEVVIVNYINSYANCLVSGGLYNVCCKDECESLFGHLEEKIAAPEATPAALAAIVEKLPSATVNSPRLLSPTMLNRLSSIAEEHGGTVPLHGRLFAQWMHHAYPLECPYPHVSGTTSQQTPEEWVEINGVDERASRKQMREFAPSSMNGTWAEEVEELPWSPEEELLVVRPRPQPMRTGSLFATLRPIVLLIVLGSLALGLSRALNAVTLSSTDNGTVKFIV